MECDACARPLPEGAKFCPFCGKEVRATGTEERRVVTVLFADIVGFTGLSEHLDPERVKRLIDGAFARMIEDIEAYGGSIDKVLGDGILALFGAPVAHEDDPDRAVRAALTMQQSLAAFSEENRFQRPVEMRVGINTGEVVVGRVGGTDDYTALGDVVNVASRLQSLAPPGGIYIGDATASGLSDDILRDAVDDLEVRGRDQTEMVWRISGLHRGAPVATSGSDVPFVGRVDQQELLTLVMNMVAGGRSAVVAVSGEAGAGKTRLVSEALRRFPGTNAVVLAGECAPYGETNVWSPIANALFRRMNLDTALSTDVLRQRAREKGIEVYGLTESDPVLGWFAEAVLHLAGHQSGLDDVAPAQARETLFRFVVEAIRRRTSTGPVIIWIDDLQWADALLVALLHRLTRSLVDRPILIITAQRDDAELDWPPASDHPVSVRIPLDPLSPAEAGSLVDAVIGRPVSERAKTSLYERSGGNPLFLTQLAELTSGDPDDSALPGSLRALISARLDRLPPDQRAIIENAAVLGTSAPVSALEHFARVLDQPYVPDDLDALEEAGFLEVDDDWWRFRSDVVREVAYETLTKTTRAYRHAGTAQVMSRIPGMPIDRVAHHVASAAELVAEVGGVDGVPATIRDDAVTVLNRSARRSLDIGAFNQAVRHATRALDLEPPDPAERRELLLLRSRARIERREVPEGRADAAEVVAAALEATDLVDEGVGRRLLGRLAQLDGDLASARTELGRSVEIFRELGNDPQLAESLAERGFVEVFGGSLADAEAVLDEAEALATQLGDRRAGAWVKEHQAWVSFLSGDPAGAHDRLENAAAAFVELGDQAGQLWAGALQAYLHFFERKFDEAEALAVDVRERSIELGERWAPAMMDSLIATLRLWTGRFSEAEELARRALGEFRDIGDRFGMLQALSPQMRALAAMGRKQEAERGLEEALSLSDFFGDLALPTMAAAGTAVHLGLGDRGVVLAESAQARILATGANPAEVRVTLALALAQVGRTEEALTTLLDIEMDFPYAYSVRALASAAIGDHDTAVEDADAVLADDGASYLDRVYADVGGAAGHVGRDEGEVALDRLNRAVATAAATGDVVAGAIATYGRSTLMGEGGDEGRATLGTGWVRLLDNIAEAAGRRSPLDG